ncbi:MAG: alpha-mannosidase [Firmicutes bacterium]|nr:alpha-mannosidase [Bacillota bacterium]
MFFTERKIGARIRELAEFRYRDAISLESMQYQIDTSGDVGLYPPTDGEWKPAVMNQRWQGRDLYVWVTATVEIPAEWKERKVLGRFDFGKTGGGGNSGFESLLFVNGKPYQGVDSNHHEVFFPPELVGTTVELSFRLWSGLEGGGKPREQEMMLRKAEICWLDEAADDLVFTSWAALETVKELDENQPERSLLLTALDRAYLLVDWSKPGSEGFYASIAEAREELNNQIAAIEKHHPVTIRCIGHTHIDVAWLWRLKHTREKGARSFSTVLRLMELYPDYVFLQSQPQLYEYIKSDYPEIYSQIKERVKEGRWEAEGGMWVEADCNITSGESLVRQLLYGTRFLRDEFGVSCKYLWLPDVFGYSWALPQILLKSGIKTFMTTKISWNQYNRMPHDTFWWRGMDGSEILTHFITTPTTGGAWFYTYNGVITPQTVKGIWDTYRDKDLNKELLLSYGYGDGGGGVNREMLELRRRLNEMPGLPQVLTGRADEYFDRLHQTVAETDQYVHTWDGELYLEYHRGTYTSQAYNKRMNRKLELLYRDTEWLSTLQSVFASTWDNYPQQDLVAGWKILLRNQFHDIIPGSSIREVYEDSTLEYEEARQLAQGNWDKAAQAIASKDEPGAYTVFNSAPWTRGGLVEIPAEEGMAQGRWLDAEGNPLTAELRDGMWLVKVDNMPAMGFARVWFDQETAGADAASPFTYGANRLTTPYYDLKWNEAGQLVSVYDLTAEREVLAPGARGNVLQVFEDKPMAHDAWDIDIFYQEKMREVTDLMSVDLVEANALQAVVRFNWRYMDSTICQDLVVYADSRRIDFRTHVDWHEQHQLLKVAFPVDIRATEATYDIQFGNVKRSTHWNTSWDQARFESVGHQWADLSEQGYGVSLLNDCKYGYDIKDNRLRLSLVKSATHPDYAADQGEHIFTYALLPHQGSWIEGGTVFEAWDLNSPLTWAKGAPQRDRFSLFALDVDNVMIDVVKKAEDEDKLVVRLHEFTGARNKVTLSTALSAASWQECNLLEEPMGDKMTGDSLEFFIKPYEIKTFLVELKK